MPSSPPVPPDDPVAQRLRAVWAAGDFPRVAREVIPGLGEVLVEACDVGPGQRVLDVGAGTGNASLPAARRGAAVVASDITPELVEAGRRLAAGEGLALDWEVADAADLPHADASFDVVMSCVGVMFAPDHSRCARELLRVLRPGGVLGLLSWTPEDFVGQLLAAAAPFAPPPPAGAQPAVLWGRESHVRELLGDAVTGVRTEVRQWEVTAFATPARFREHFTTHYGPLVAVRAGLAGDPERTAAFDLGVEEVARAAMARGGGAGVMRWEYLLLTARRR